MFLERRIALCGSHRPDFLEENRERLVVLGKVLAEYGFTFYGGMSPNFPDVVIQAGRTAGAKAYGYSPWISKEEHLERGDPWEYDHIEVVGKGFEYNSKKLIGQVEAIVVVSGGEFTGHEILDAIEQGRVVGILSNIPGIGDAAGRLIAFENLIVEEDPRLLVERIVEKLDLRSQEEAL
jgi:predicted Rossmann-fold nucleotide-binding protein